MEENVSPAQRQRLRNRRPASDGRSLEEIEHHYKIERELSDRLRDASRGQRLQLYPSLYDEICRRVPNIPGWNVPLPPEALRRNVANKVLFLKQFVTPESAFLELGPGDCSVSLAMADHVKQVFAVDVSSAITEKVQPPSNFRLVISDGVSIDVPPESVDVAYSNQLMEHLHPDDAEEQLRNVAAVLKPGGVYICITPSKLSGPHDVSKYFDDTPTGFHLREYSTTELAKIFKASGFSSVRPFVWVKQRLAVLPLPCATLLESMLQLAPSSMRRAACNRAPLNYMLGRVIARKDK